MKFKLNLKIDKELEKLLNKLKQQLKKKLKKTSKFLYKRPLSLIKMNKLLMKIKLLFNYRTMAQPLLRMKIYKFKEINLK